MENKFIIKYDLSNGGVSSMVHPDDPYAMNWVEGFSTWGVIKNAEFISAKETQEGIDAHYRTSKLDIYVKRVYKDSRYHETYTFKNNNDYDVFFMRGDIGIYTCFNDSYEGADICMTNRCHTHIWCGGNVSYINAVKMGICDFALGLVLTEGSLDTYSVDIDFDLGYAERGDFILHPSVCHILPGGEMTVSWDMFWYKSGEFFEEIEKYPTGILIDTENYTVFSDEKISFSINKAEAQVYLDGEKLDTVVKDGRTYVEYIPKSTGEHLFDIRFGNIRTHAEFYVQIPFRDLVRQRVNFIVDKQQFHCPGSAIDGAYLIYDNEDECMYFDYKFRDHNASRERLVMGLLVAKYLQYEHDDKIYASLMKYYEFVTREFYDESTGEVYDTLGKNPEFKRLYNAPWMSMLVMEMYKLTGDDTYLDKMYKLLCVYYTIGGEKFYPNGLTMYETVKVLQDVGKIRMADDLMAKYKVHVGNILKFGANYPIHEVNYEQTIVSPGAALVSQMCALTGDESLIPEAKKQIDILERFNGNQPSFKLNEMAIRYWDGYFFGKSMMRGDTLPHAASIHTHDAFMMYYDISGDENIRKRAIKGARNVLSLFRENGRAYTSFIYPLKINDTRCEFFDEFANEQDGALYFMIKYFNMFEE